jgi:hypothetical protein
MIQLPPEVKLDQKEPYPNFYGTLHQLILGQIEITRLRILIIKIAIGIVITIVALNILLCILSIVLPIFGISIIAWIYQQLKFPVNVPSF